MDTAWVLSRIMDAIYAAIPASFWVKLPAGFLILQILYTEQVLHCCLLLYTCWVFCLWVPALDFCCSCWILPGCWIACLPAWMLDCLDSACSYIWFLPYAALYLGLVHGSGFSYIWFLHIYAQFLDSYWCLGGFYMPAIYILNMLYTALYIVPYMVLPGYIGLLVLIYSLGSIYICLVLLPGFYIYVPYIYYGSGSPAAGFCHMYILANIYMVCHLCPIPALYIATRFIYMLIYMLLDKLYILYIWTYI